VVNSCEHGNDPLGFIKVGEYLNYLNDNFSRISLLLGMNKERCF
jgi:hypothetical protein